MWTLPNPTQYATTKYFLIFKDITDSSVLIFFIIFYSRLEDDCVATGSLSLQRASARENHNSRDG